MTKQTLWQRIRVCGDDYVVLLDPSNDLWVTGAVLHEIRALGGPRLATGVIRAIHTVHASNADQILREDPAAAWSCDVRSPDGTPVRTSGSGVRALVHALVGWGELAFEDRRDAIPVGTPGGIRDVLIGRSGYAVDLGRWRSLGNDGTVTVQIGGERVTVVTGGHLDHDPVPARLQGHVSPAQMRVERGIAHARVTICDREDPDRQASSLAAAAAALVLRHLGPLDTPHHWAIEMPGGTIGVRMFATEDGEHVSVSGPVTVIATGEGCSEL